MSHCCIISAYLYICANVSKSIVKKSVNSLPSFLGFHGLTFIDKPYFDEEEKEFWMTHYVSRRGIVERTPADIAAMRRFLGEENK